MKITEAQARRIARQFAAVLSTEDLTKAVLTNQDWLADALQRFSEATEYGKASAAEERDAQRESIRDAVWLWMARVYERSPRQELGETMELKIIADQSGYCSSPDRSSEFEAFTFRIETTTTEGEY